MLLRRVAVVDLVGKLWWELLLRHLLGRRWHLHRHMRGLLRHLGVLHVRSVRVAHLRVHNWRVSGGIHRDNETVGLWKSYEWRSAGSRARWKEGGEGGERGGWVELVELRGPAKRDAEVKAGRVAGAGRGAGFRTKGPFCNFNCLLRASLPFRACWRWADVFHSLQLIFSRRGIATQS